MEPESKTESLADLMASGPPRREWALGPVTLVAVGGRSAGLTLHIWRLGLHAGLSGKWLHVGASVVALTYSEIIEGGITLLGLTLSAELRRSKSN